MVNGTGVPDRVEFLQIKPRHRWIIKVGDAVPRVRTHAIHNRPIVGYEVRGSTLRSVGCNVADVNTARKAPTHRYEPVAIPHHARGFSQEDPHLRKAAGQDEL